LFARLQDKVHGENEVVKFVKSNDASNARQMSKPAVATNVFCGSLKAIAKLLG
jgi:hypothetical protein